jgi:hypothetical protein
MIKIKSELVGGTIRELQTAGAANEEGIVLWLGRRTGPDAGVVQRIYVPLHEAQSDRFWISFEGMRAMMDRLRQDRFCLLAQVHSHPDRAFHSQADDQWALVRHAGGLSIVVPNFAATTTEESFWRESAFFQLDNENRWREIFPDPEIIGVLR